MQSNNKPIRIESGRTTGLNFLKKFFFRNLTRYSTNIFLRGGDIISIDPQTTGIHESDLTTLIRQRSHEGYSDFFIDIGANIGLISCQVGNLFKQVICYEPNPLCVNVLRTNTAIAINHSAVAIRDHGLGSHAGELELWIPKHNWGGAFVRSPENSYSDEMLATKDGWRELDPRNYITRTVQIKNALNDLSESLAALTEQQLLHGIIKIDVEGMELVILEAISKAISPNMKVTILFENWDKGLNIGTVDNFFADRQVAIQKITCVNPYKEYWPRLFKAIALSVSSRKIYLQTIDEHSDTKGDICLTIT